MDASAKHTRRIVILRVMAAVVVLAAGTLGRDVDAATKCICTEQQRTVWDISDRGCDAVCHGSGVAAGEIDDRVTDGDADNAPRDGACFHHGRWMSCREARRRAEQEDRELPAREVICDRGHVASPENPTPAEIARCRTSRPKTRYQPR